MDSSAATELESLRTLNRVWSLPGGFLPWITLCILVFSAAATAVAMVDPDPVYRFLYASGAEIWLNRKWWGVIGSLFIHADLLHLIFNAYWTWIFGRLLERELGWPRFLGLVLGGALVGGAAELAWSGDLGVGLSGVVYSFFGFLMVSPARHPDFRRILPASTRWLMIGWLGFCFVLTYSGALAVANFAHLGGLLIGCLAGLASGSGARRFRARAGCVVAVALSLLTFVWAPWQETWQMARAYRALEARDEAEALSALAKIQAKNPDNTWALRQEAALLGRRGEHLRQRDLLKRALAADDKDASLFNELAWLLATCPDAAARDGALALKLANKACEMTAWQNAAVIDTLAAAHAELGDFDEAESRVRQALKVDPSLRKELEPHLTAFRAGRPWRETNGTNAEKPSGK